MGIIRKLFLVIIGLGFAFIVTSCNDPNHQSSLADCRVKEKQDKHHNRW